jgi:hypothetical protein
MKKVKPILIQILVIASLANAQEKPLIPLQVNVENGFTPICQDSR